MSTVEAAAVSRLSAGDGTTLCRRRWTPPADVAPVADRIVIVHGLGEHGGRHDALARMLAASGRVVDSVDLRGHGETVGARGAVPDDDALFSDIARLIDVTGTQPSGAGEAWHSVTDATTHASPRLVLIGHSLGGALAARFVAEGLHRRSARASWFRRVDALVLSSPALDAGLSVFQRMLARVLRQAAPTLAVGNGLDPDWISRDPAVVAAYRADPLVHDRITPRLVGVMLDAGRDALAQAPRWRVPTLLMWAGADRCVRPEGSARFAAAAPAGMVEAVEWPGLAHEIFNEPEREAVLARLLAWLDGPASRVAGR